MSSTPTKDPPLCGIDSGDGSSQDGISARPKGNAPSFASRFEKRRGFTKKQNLRRQVYRDLTVFQTFPLQAMAMDDYDRHLAEHFGGGQISDDCSDGSESVCRTQRRARDAGTESTPSSDDCAILPEQFLREFLKEKSIRVSIGAVTEISGARQSNGGGEVEDHTQNGNNSSVSDGGEKADMIGNTADECPGDKENVPQQNSTQQTPMSRSGKSDGCQEQPCHPKEQSTNESITSSSDQDHIPNEKWRQFLPALWSMEPRMFAMETPLKGKRRYISAHLGRFMDHYWRDCDVHNRHYYELIKEGSPCRLYFDLEFNKRSNPHLTPTVTDVLLTELFDELRHEFQNMYNISIERSCMVDLDSSTPKKFSRHWIFHLPGGKLFSDNREIGVFVKVFVSRLEEDRESGSLQSRGREVLAANLFVNAEGSEDGNSKLTRFIDLGVYTRNRIFRLLGSTKFGKPADAALRIAEANEFPFPISFDNTKFYLPEMGKGPQNDSDADAGHNGVGDVSLVPSQCDDFESFCNSLSFEDHATAMAATLVVPANSSKMHHPILIDPSYLLNGDEKRQMPLLKQLNGSGRISATSKFSREARQYGPSPFPKLERFILNTLGNRRGIIGNIGTWSLGTHQPLPQTVSYTMKDNRFCDNIGRAHKSNNIIWNVHLIDRICRQGCHDPECHGFRGEAFDLPEEVNLEIEEWFFDYELSSLNENEIIENKNEQAVPGENGEFDDLTLEALMCQLDISRVVRKNEKTALYNELLGDEPAQLKLSSTVSGNNGVIGEHLSNGGDKNVDASNLETKPFVQSMGVENNVVSPEPWESDDELDSELAKLNLSDIRSQCQVKKL